MIPKQFIKKLKDQIEKSDQARSRIIRESYSAVREAKKAIFKIHRGEISQAEKELSSLENKISQIEKFARKLDLRADANLHSAIEEFLEALYFLKVIQGKPIPQKVSFSLTPDEQLGALADLTGELVRSATIDAISGNYSSIKKYRNATEDLFGVLLQMDLRGTLRQKRDDARRNLKRMEEILYDLSLKR